MAVTRYEDGTALIREATEEDDAASMRSSNVKGKDKTVGFRLPAEVAGMSSAAADDAQIDRLLDEALSYGNTIRMCEMTLDKIVRDSQVVLGTRAWG